VKALAHRSWPPITKKQYTYTDRKKCIQTKKRAKINDIYFSMWRNWLVITTAYDRQTDRQAQTDTDIPGHS